MLLDFPCPIRPNRWRILSHTCMGVCKNTWISGWVNECVKDLSLLCCPFLFLFSLSLSSLFFHSHSLSFSLSVSFTFSLACSCYISPTDSSYHHHHRQHCYYYYPFPFLLNFRQQQVRVVSKGHQIKGCSLLVIDHFPPPHNPHSCVLPKITGLLSNGLSWLCRGHIAALFFHYCFSFHYHYYCGEQHLFATVTTHEHLFLITIYFSTITAIQRRHFSHSTTTTTTLVNFFLGCWTSFPFAHRVFLLYWHNPIPPPSRASILHHWIFTPCTFNTSSHDSHDAGLLARTNALIAR